MVDSEQPDERRFFLAFVEQHWRELSLRDASFLCAETFDAFALTYPRDATDT